MNRDRAILSIVCEFWWSESQVVFPQRRGSAGVSELAVSAIFSTSISRGSRHDLMTASAYPCMVQLDQAAAPARPWPTALLGTVCKTIVIERCSPSARWQYSSAGARAASVISLLAFSNPCPISNSRYGQNYERLGSCHSDAGPANARGRSINEYMRPSLKLETPDQQIFIQQSITNDSSIQYANEMPPCHCIRI